MAGVGTVIDRSGDVLVGRYVVKDLIDVGGMGSVWTAEHLALKREVVVKFLEESLGNEPELALSRFLREARLLSGLSHRNVIAHHESGATDASEPFLIMERLRGETLAARMTKEEPLTVSEAIEICACVADGLEAVHEAGVLHRDVKPANIFLFLEAGGRVTPKLLDFGLARSEVAGVRDTRRGRTVGTPGYMAPEQARGRGELDGRVDVYALGATLYEVICGKFPVSGRTPMERIINAGSEPPIPITHRRPELAGPLADAIMKALAPHRDDRHENARAMADALRATTELHLDELTARNETQRSRENETVDSEADGSDRARLPTDPDLEVT